MAVGASVAADYALLFRRFDDYTADDYKAERSGVHRRAAAWMLWLARAHGGIYVKAAQHIAGLVYIVPAELTDTLKVLQDRAPFRPLDAMRPVLLEDFAVANVHDLFAEFSDLPIAAASLAQVHRAVTRDGQEVAVKIQYPDVARLFDVDMTTLQTLSSLIAAAFPDFQLEWVAKEFRKNLIQEFDFTNEAKNCEMTAARFAYRAADVRCPEIRWDLTSRRVLTMEFIHGVKVNNVPAIRSLGLDPADVRSVLSQAFAEMIFCHGVLHCDPHPGNAFIVRSPARPDKPQLVILDHGLYRYISDEFRLLYCQLWKALVLGDVALLRDVSARLGVPQYADYFPLIFTNRVMGSASLLGESVSKEDRARLRQQFKDTTLAQVLVFLESLPREILLASRVSNLIRGIHQELGGENIERFSDNATYAILGSYFSTSKPVRDALTAERLDTRGAARSRVVAFQLTARIDSFTDRIRFWRDLAWLRVRLWLGQSFVLTLRWLRSWNLA